MFHSVTGGCGRWAIEGLLGSGGDHLGRIDRRRCSRCGEKKPIEEFPFKNKARGLRRVWCRDCCRAYGREHYRKNKPAYLAKNARRRKTERRRIREKIIGYLKAQRCLDCGESDVLLLDFDHRDQAEKRAVISRIANSGSWAAVLAEIRKCDVRCVNCHRRRTAEQFRWRKDPKRGPLDPAIIAALGPVLTRPSSTGTPVIEQLSIWSALNLKRCSRCHEWKPELEYAFRNRKTGDRNDYCRPCQAAYRRDHYQRHRARYLERAQAQMLQRREDHVRRLHEYLRDHPCVDCGETDIRVLEFDHADGVGKVLDVSRMLGKRNWKQVRDEIDKCDVRCANCHRRRTAVQRGWRSRMAEAAARYRHSLNWGSRGCGVTAARNLPKVEAGDRPPSPAQ